jgi:hypothetical protein
MEAACSRTLRGLAVGGGGGGAKAWAPGVLERTPDRANRRAHDDDRAPKVINVPLDALLRGVQRQSGYSRPRQRASAWWVKYGKDCSPSWPEKTEQRDPRMQYSGSPGLRAYFLQFYHSSSTQLDM